MTALTMKETVEAISDYLIGTGKDITDAQLITYQALVSTEVTRLNPGFTGDELTKFTAYFVLDLYGNKSGTIPIMEKIRDNQYNLKAPLSSSFWKDQALGMIAQYQTNSNSYGNDEDGVNRIDSDMPEFSDGYSQPVYGSADDLLDT